MATKRRIAALAAALLGTGLAASAQAQAPVPIGPTTDMTARYGPAAMPAPGGFPGGPAPYGMSPAYGPGYGPGAPIGMTPGAGPGMPPAGSSAPPGMPMPAAPPGMGGMPPGMMPPQPPAGLGLPNNLQREVEGNAYTPPLEDPDRKETDPSRWTVGIEPFFLFHRGIRLPVTVTTGNSVLDPVPGALNEPTTQILNGGAAYNGGTYFGTNFRLGYAILDQDRLFLDASYFITESKATYFDAGSDTSGNPVLSRPYFDPTAKTFNVDPRSFPNVLAGTVHDETSTRYQGAQLNLKLNFTQNGKAADQDLFFIAGPRWFRIDEYYQASDTVTELPAGTGSSFIFNDRFGTSNTFFGAQLGTQWFVRFSECFTMDVAVKAVFGMNHQQVDISGATQLTDTSGNLTGIAGNVLTDRTQGFYTQPSNIGHYSRNQFTWGPELGVNFAYAINDNVKLGFGYTLFCIDKIVRPGDQIDPVINIQPLFGGGGFGIARPVEVLRQTNWVTQSINITCEFVF